MIKQKNLFRTAYNVIHELLKETKSIRAPSVPLQFIFIKVFGARLTNSYEQKKMLSVICCTFL